MPREKWMSLLAALAALAGAAGVIEAAYAAHGSPDPLLQTSSHFLVLHATAGVAIAGFARAAANTRLMLLAGTLLMVGTIVFCSDLSMRALTGAKLFSFAAPIGGTTMIAGWLFTAIAALWSLRKSA
jgi:uncharacterized membrane protein YgdD (TMEM256/DUF423 family)